jgi:AcrR family transcriptional regulator
MFLILTTLFFLASVLTDQIFICKIEHMGVTERKEREREALRERILDAALEVVSAGGVDALTMRGIADRIEYSATALYTHFADKDALLVALCHREFQQLSVRLQDFRPSGDPLADLTSLGRAYCRFALTSPEAYRLMFLLPGMPSRPAHCSDDEQDAYGIVVSAVARARAAGLLRDNLGDDELVGQTLWANLHGLLALEIIKHDKGIPWRPINDRVELSLRMIIDGIRR